MYVSGVALLCLLLKLILSEFVAVFVLTGANRCVLPQWPDLPAEQVHPTGQHRVWSSCVQCWPELPGWQHVLQPGGDVLQQWLLCGRPDLHQQPMCATGQCCMRPDRCVPDQPILWKYLDRTVLPDPEPDCLWYIVLPLLPAVQRLHAAVCRPGRQLWSRGAVVPERQPVLCSGADVLPDPVR
jgi:hypothetical protein